MTENTTASGADDHSKLLPELLDLIRFQQEYIVAIPSDVAASLPAMPGFDGDWAVDLVERAKALAASAPVAPTQPESLHTFLNAAAAEGYVLNGVDAADLYVELFPERYVAALEWFHSGRHEASAETAPVAPAPQPAAPLTDTFVQTVPDKCDRIVWRNNYYHLPIAAAPKADHIEDDLAMVPAPLQQGEYPETLYEGGRESVDDALAVVESFGPGVQGLNDTFARQVLLGQEVRRLRAAYEHACKGRSDFRNLYRAARGQAQAAPAEYMLIDWPLYNKDPLLELDDIYADYSKSFGITPGPVMAKIVQRHQARLQSWFGGHREAIRSALVDKARAQAAQPEGGAA